MTDDKKQSIIDLLRSDVDGAREAALKCIFPDQTVTLVISKPNHVQMASSEDASVPQVMGALVWAAVSVGKAMGLDLHWVPASEPKDGIQVAHESDVPPPGFPPAG